jgi:cytochrome c peroxidase
MSAARVELGRYLFYDKRISFNGKESCGSCHRQELAFTDGRAHAEGTTGQLHPRSSMSLVNVGYAAYLTWANPALTSLEEQALTPILGEDPVELGLKGHEQDFLTAIRGDEVYRRLFPLAFPGETNLYALANVTKAIAAFERTIISLRSPYDRYRWGGDLSAISEAAKRGELIFSSSERGGCFQCHGGWTFSGGIRFEGRKVSNSNDEERGGFFNTGVSTYEAPNRGVYEQTHRAEDIGKFRAPTLRNIAVTAPYMHDGSLSTLEDVIDHYAAGGKFDHPNKTHILHRFSLTDGDRHDLVEFLKSLTDEALLHDPRWSDPWQTTSTRKTRQDTR